MENSLSTIVVPEHLITVNISVNQDSTQLYEIFVDPSLIEVAEAMDVDITNQKVTSVYEMGALVNSYHEKIATIIQRLNNFKQIKTTVFNQYELNDICVYGNTAQLNNMIANIIKSSHVKSFTALDSLCKQQGKKFDYVDIMEYSSEIEELKNNPMYKRETFAILHLYLEDYASLEATFAGLNIMALFNKNISNIS